MLCKGVPQGMELELVLEALEVLDLFVGNHLVEVDHLVLLQNHFFESRCLVEDNRVVLGILSLHCLFEGNLPFDCCNLVRHLVEVGLPDVGLVVDNLDSHPFRFFENLMDGRLGRFDWMNLVESDNHYRFIPVVEAGAAPVSGFPVDQALAPEVVVSKDVN